MNEKNKPNVTAIALDNNEERKKTIQITYYITLAGSMVYILGLFLPYYHFDDFSVMSIDFLYFGKIYFLMMSFVGVVSIIGLITKWNLLRLIIPNIFVCTIEILVRAMIEISKLWIFFELVGPGQYVVLFGAVIAFFGASSYLAISSLEAERNSGIFPPDQKFNQRQTRQTVTIIGKRKPNAQ